MSHLVVAAFDNEYEAEEVRTKLLRMQSEHLLELEDAAVVVKKADGAVTLRQSHNLPLAGAASGSFWGLLFGLLFAAPLAGVVLGAGAGALTGALTDIGINDAFMRDLGQSLAPRSSALFILVRRATPDKVVEALQPFRGKLLRTSLSAADEAALREALESRGVADPQTLFR